MIIKMESDTKMATYAKEKHIKSDKEINTGNTMKQAKYVSVISRWKIRSSRGKFRNI